MGFAGLKDPRQRAGVIAYLRLQADKPLPLPAAAAAPAAPLPQTAKVEDFDGLPPGEGREETHAICAACHSLRIVQQQGLDTDCWDDLMTWMTEKQGMPALPAADRKRIVGYLAKNFGPDRGGRARTNPMMPSMPPMPTAPMMPPMPPMP
jgi:mono/diheme cytochrome c family protein